MSRDALPGERVCNLVGMIERIYRYQRELRQVSNSKYRLLGLNHYPNECISILRGRK